MAIDASELSQDPQRQAAIKNVAKLLEKGCIGQPNDAPPKSGHMAPACAAAIKAMNEMPKIAVHPAPSPPSPGHHPVPHGLVAKKNATPHL